MRFMSLGLAIAVALVVMVASAGGAGVVVEGVSPTGAAGQAGIVAGDLLLSWRREPRPPANPETGSGLFTTPFDLDQVEAEHKPLGTIVLHGEREGVAFTLDLPPGLFGITARPAMDGACLSAYRTAVAAGEAGDAEASAAGLGELADAARLGGGRTTFLWFLVRAAEVAKAGSYAELADGLRENALAAARGGGDLSLYAWVLHVSAESGRRHAERSRIGRVGPCRFRIS